MNDIVFNVILYAILPVLITLVSYIVRGIMQRLERLESGLTDKISEQEVRQILTDKLEPVTDDLKEIKDKVDKVIDHLINK